MFINFRGDTRREYFYVVHEQVMGRYSDESWVFSPFGRRQVIPVAKDYGICFGSSVQQLEHPAMYMCITVKCLGENYGYFWPSCFPVLCRTHCFGDLFCCYYRMLHSVQCGQSFFAVFPWDFWIKLPFLTPYWKPKFRHLSFIWCLTTFCPVFVEWRSLLIQGIEDYRDTSYLDCTQHVSPLVFSILCMWQSWHYLYPL